MMKKLCAMLLAAVACVGMLTGCGSSQTKPEGAGGAKLKDGETLQGIVDRIEQEVGIQMPGDLDDGLLKDMIYIDPKTDADEYAGKISMAMISADNVIAVKAKADKKQVVVDALNKRLKDVQASFEQYLPDQKEKSEKGKIIEKGDYVFLVVIGQDIEQFDADMKKAEEIINSAFEG